MKPVLFIANVDEEGIQNDNASVRVLREIAHTRQAPLVVLNAEMEAEVSQMPYQEREVFLKDLGINKSGLDQVIHEGYRLLSLITFFTHNEKELRAWTVTEGTKAPQAAGKIHSDFERGFIRAEVIKSADLVQYGSEHAIRETGHFAVHGHDYVVEDGDVIFFRFNV
jgi:ribosome-binding ATPase